jgi:hypothetical protein
MFKNHQRKSSNRVLKKEEDTYGSPVFAPDYTTTGLAAKMCINPNEQSMYIRFLWTGIIIAIVILFPIAPTSKIIV